MQSSGMSGRVFSLSLESKMERYRKIRSLSLPRGLGSFIFRAFPASNFASFFEANTAAQALAPLAAGCTAPQSPPAAAQLPCAIACEKGGGQLDRCPKAAFLRSKG